MTKETEKMRKLFFWHGYMWRDYVTNDREVDVFRAGMREMRYLVEIWLLGFSMVLLIATL